MIWPLGDDASGPIFAPGVGSPVRAVSFLGDHYVVIGTYDGRIRILPNRRFSEGEAYAVLLEGHREPIRRLIVTADLRFVVSQSAGELRVWRTTTTPAQPSIWTDASVDPLVLWNRDAESITSIAFDPTGRRIAAGSTEGNIFVWPEDGEDEPRRIAAHDSDVIGVAWTTEALVTASNHSARIWRLEQLGQTPEREFDCGGEEISAMAVNASARGYGLGCGEQTRIWSDESKEPQILAAAGERITALRFHPSGAMLATGSESRIVRLWNLGPVPTSRAARVAGPVTSLAFDSTGRWLAIGTAAYERALTVLETSTLSVVFEASAREVTSVAFNSDGSELATGSSEFNATEYGASLWRWRRGDTRPVVLGHHLAPVTAVSFQPGTDRLVTGSRDTALRVWRTTFADLLDHLRAVTNVCLTTEARERLLLESSATARLAFERCQRRQHRSP
jgi:WD40 repeat protein